MIIVEDGKIAVERSEGLKKLRDLGFKHLKIVAKGISLEATLDINLESLSESFGEVTIKLEATSEDIGISTFSDER